MSSELQTMRDRLLVIDTETGGLNPQTDSILSLGLVSWDGAHQREIFIAEETFHTHPRSMEINRIDLDWLRAHGLCPSDACDQLDEFLDQTLDQTSGAHPFILAGHNISFDLAFIKRLYHLARRPLPQTLSHRSVDTHTLLWMLATLGEIPLNACTSDGAFSYYQVAPPEKLRHTALGDALATRELLMKLLKTFEMIEERSGG